MTARVKELTDRATTSERPRTQPAHGLRGLLDAFGRLGYDVDDLLAAAGLTRADVADPDALLPCSSISDICARSQRLRPLKNLALRLALETPIGAFPLLDYLVLSSDTVGDAFRQLARYLGIVGSPIAFAFHDEEEPVRVVLSAPGNVFAIEYTVLLSLVHMRRETEGEVAASIHFSHRPEDVGEIEQHLRCPVRAEDDWDGFSLTRASWARRPRRRDPILHALLERQADDAAERLSAPQDARSRLRDLLVRRLTTGDVRIDAAARQLGTTPRTLQRRLADTGTTYQELLEEIRREAAAGYMRQSDLSAGQIGYLLGYSEPAAFHRAFKRWYRVTPLEYRRKIGG